MIMGFHSWIHFLSIWFSIWNSASISVSISFFIWIEVSISVSGFRFQTPFGLSFLLDGMEKGKRNGRCFSNGKQNGKFRGCKMEQKWKTHCVFHLFSISHSSKVSIWFSMLFLYRKLIHFIFHFLSTPKELYFLLKFLRIRAFRLPSWLRRGKTGKQYEREKQNGKLNGKISA